jgi:tetratricopeptide (TPR) repeat protein
VQLDSNSATYLSNLGNAYIRKDQPADALPLLRRSLALEADSWSTLFFLGNCFFSMGVHDSSEQYYEQSVESGGKSPVLFFNLARVEQNLGKLDKAENHYKTSLQWSPDNTDCLAALGDLYANQGRFGEAAERFRRVVDIDSTHHPAWVSLGVSYYLDRQFAQADTVLFRLSQLAPERVVEMQEIIHRIASGGGTNQKQ